MLALCRREPTPSPQTLGARRGQNRSRRWDGDKGAGGSQVLSPGVVSPPYPARDAGAGELTAPEPNSMSSGLKSFISC